MLIVTPFSHFTKTNCITSNLLARVGIGAAESWPKFSTAAAWPVHTPCLVMLDHAAKSFCRGQAFVDVDHNGHVAQAESRADVCFFACDADAPFNSLRVVRYGMSQAVHVAAYVQVGLHVSSFLFGALSHYAQSTAESVARGWRSVRPKGAAVAVY